MNRRASQSIVANPVLVGAVTVLVVVVAVFLAYNANNGLPFVPTKQIFVDAPSGSNLVKGNEVREGGYRVGVIQDIKPLTLPTGETIARFDLKLDKKVGAIPTDSTVKIRPRSALGLKYVELTRGQSKRELRDGDTIPLGQANVPVQFDDVYRTFNAPTRKAAQENLDIFGDAFTGRGVDLNTTIQNLPPLLKYLEPVARNLSSRDTQLARFFQALERTAGAVAPVQAQNIAGLRDAGITFEAISRDPKALQDTIAKSPSTLDVSTRSLHDQRPFLRDLALFSGDLRGAVRDLRISLPTINSALGIAPPILRRSVSLSQKTSDVLAALDDLVTAPTTNQALRGLTATLATLNPQLRFLGPYQTVCNYWNYFWTFLGEHISEDTPSGTAQRAELGNAPMQTNSPGDIGAYEPANGEQNALQAAASGGSQAAVLHGQPYHAAITESGRADCENGQRGYLNGPLSAALVRNHPNDFQGNKFRAVTDPHTPGEQGPTFAGRTAVPAGETFSREPDGPLSAKLPAELTTGIYAQP